MRAGKGARIAHQTLEFHDRPSLFYRPRELRPLGALDQSELIEKTRHTYLKAGAVGMLIGAGVWTLLYLTNIISPRDACFPWICIVILFVVLPDKYRAELHNRTIPDTENRAYGYREGALRTGVDCPACSSYVVFAGARPPFQGKCWKCGGLMDVAEARVKQKMEWYDRKKRKHQRWISYDGLAASKAGEPAPGRNTVLGTE